MFKCASCELCGRNVDAELMCTLTLTEENKEDKACWCVCADCKEKFLENIDRVYKELIEDMKKQ